MHKIRDFSETRDGDDWWTCKTLQVGMATKVCKTLLLVIGQVGLEKDLLWAFKPEPNYELRITMVGEN